MSAPRCFDIVDISAELDRLQEAVSTACNAACRAGVPLDIVAHAVGSMVGRRAFVLAGGDGLDRFVSFVRDTATDESLWKDGPARHGGSAGAVLQ